MTSDYDVIIIGGGINGCGIARDCAMRGLRVALFERNDFGAGATWASSGMIHGGLRYLSSDPEVTRRSCEDSGNIQRIARHLIFRIPFLMAFREADPKARTLLPAAEIYFQTYDRYAPLKGGLPSKRLSAGEARQIEPGLVSDVIGAVTTDEWGIDAARLTLLNALAAEANGADIHNHTDVVEVLRDAGRVLGVCVRDRDTGARRTVRAPVVMNATGAWGQRFLQGQGVHGLSLRPAKGIHLIYPGRLTNYAVVSQAVDGRQIFVCPHQNVTLVGTTDDDYYGDMDDVPVLQDEVEYLIQGAAHMFPSIRRHRFIETTVGCRPTLHQYGRSEDDLRRHHAVIDHAHHGASGLLSIAGGKLAAYRLMAADATEAIFRTLGKPAPPCRTASTALPGADPHSDDLTPFRELGVNPYAATRMLARQGGRCAQILTMLRENPSWSRAIDPSEGITEAELRYCLRQEHVGELSDLRLRLRLGAGPDQGRRGVLPAAQVFCDERGLQASAAPDVAAQFHASRRRRMRPVPPAGLRTVGIGADFQPPEAAAVVVIGSGIAGAAAALAARAAGHHVVVYTDRPGGTALWRGRLTGHPVPELLAPILMASPGQAVTEAGRVVATAGGSVNNALPDGPLTWVDLGDSPFDAASSAAALAAATGQQVEVLRVDALSADSVSAATGALLVPALGRTVEEVRALHARLGRPVCERVTETSPRPGLRLWNSLQTLLAERGVRVVRQRVSAPPATSPCILGTGRFLTGALRDGPPIRETVAGLPLRCEGRDLDRGTTLWQVSADAIRAFASGNVVPVGALARGGSPETICLEMVNEAVAIGSEGAA